jgi:hypothetical protein
VIGPLGWLFALSTVLLAVWLYRTQDREAALLKINKGLRARIVALQKEIRERDEARMLRFKRKAGTP